MGETQEKSQGRVGEFIADPRRAVWTLSLPVMMGMAVYTFYNLTDMFFVGMLGGDALAALSFNMPVVFLAIGMVFGLGTGATSAIARSLGAGDRKAAEDAARQTMAMGLLFAAAVIAAALLFKGGIMTALGASGEVAALAVRYFEVAAPGFAFVVVNTCFRSIMTGEGNTKTPVLFQAGGTLLNIALDPLLIFTAGLGIAGAAWATIISQFAVMLLFLFYIFVRRGSYLNLGSGPWGLTRTTAGLILKVGLPSSGSMLLISGGSIFYNRIVSVFGSEAVAGLGIGGRMDSIFFMPVFALATSQVTLAGMFHGAGRIDLVRKTLVYTVLRAEVLAVVFGLGFYLFAPQLAGAFTDDERIARVATSYLRVFVLAFPFIAAGLISSRVFQGLGSGVPAMVITALRVVLIAVPVAYALTRYWGFGLTAVWWTFVASAVASSLLSVIWISRRLRREEAEPGGTAAHRQRMDDSY